MSRARVPGLPHGEEALSAIPADQPYHPQADELLRCWFCYRSAWAVWQEGIIKCHGFRACQTHYLLLPNKSKFPLLAEKLRRVRCEDCQEGTLNLRPLRLRCGRCHQGQESPKGLRFDGVVALLNEDEWRAAVARGYVDQAHQPTWRLRRIEAPWQPRVDLAPAEEKRRRRLYVRAEAKRLEAGVDPTVDHRREPLSW